jgi:hypothetical protein
VRFDDKAALPPVLFGRRPSERELIDYFLLGREPGISDGFSGLTGGELDEAPPSDEPIDTRRILSYFIRRFVQAIPGMEAAVRQAMYSRAALYSALFGPTSPVALARQVAESLSRPSLPDEPKKTPIAVGFQLVEITAALLRCRNQASDAELRSVCDQAIVECRQLLDAVCTAHPEQLAIGPFDLYRKQFTESLT